MSQLKNDLTAAITSVAQDWKKAKRQADRQDRISFHALNRMRYRPTRKTIKDAAFEVMEDAYQKASGGSRYPANARQIYYAARPQILRATGETELNSQYFTQTLLKDYLETYRPAWDVVFDARGHLTEPHTGKMIGLGGLEVRQYMAQFTDGKFHETPYREVNCDIPTMGPRFRYGAVLFIEKEGFDPLLERANIAERFDVAIASTKGMPVSALCDLLSRMRAYDIKAYVVHDFDKSGFSIVSTLRRGTRGSRGSGEIIDLGFRLTDIAELERERVWYRGVNPGPNLRRNGATEEEIAVLLEERVELNAMTSDQFIDWLERKLKEHEIKKLIPDSDALAAAYRRAVFLRRMQEEEEKLREIIAGQWITVPDRLASIVLEGLKDQPELAWDEVIWKLVANDKQD